MIKDILQHNENIDPAAKQLNILKEHFPACFAADGSFDLLRFKEEIEDKTNVLQEGYELKFLGKSYAKLIASTETTTVIQPNEAHNSLPENIGSENIYISGDNLDGLKHLLKSYQGGIKCIYIDPPYNTGTDGFVYQDKFNYTKETLQEKLSVNEVEAERILDLTKRGSASHSAWLMFMYSRLLLARDLLKDEGVIFLSIDDNEQANLKLLCDDVFGEENFGGTIIWKKKTNGNNMGLIPPVHDYILVYTRKREKVDESEFGYPLDEALIKKKFSNPDNDSRGPWDTMDLSANHVGPYFPITNPDTQEVHFPPNGRYWVFNEMEVKQRIEDGRIIFGKSGKSKPVQKVFLKDKVIKRAKAETWWDKHGLNEDGTEELTQLFGRPKLFSHAKPTITLKNLINIATKENQHDHILDFFSGSASTAHAVMQLNAEDNGNRRFIAIQLPEQLDSKNLYQKSASEFLIENNLPTTLDYIGIERIKLAAVKTKMENSDNELDLGFKHYILVEPAQNTLDKLESFDKAGMLTDTTILDDFGKPTVLATWLNTDGYGLTAEAEAVNLGGYTAYRYKKHLYLIDGSFTLESMKALIQKYDTEGGFNPENLVIFGYSFPDWSINEMIEKNLRVLNDSEKNLKINYAVRY